MKKTALILAGGRGERFWPQSRQRLPKQFLCLTDDGKTMLQLTAERIRPLVEWEDLYIATNAAYLPLVRQQLPELPPQNILCEPVGRNTAPCIGLGAVRMARKDPDAIMLVLPADHLITNAAIFCDTLRDACAVAEQGPNLVTLGIMPDSPETGYGYIKFRAEQTLGRAYAVERFVEKPDLDTAREYLASRQYLWNSGMFIWKVSTILENLQRYLPETFAGLCRIGAAISTPEEQTVLETEFTAFRAQSIDYGVMEKAAHIYVIAGAFGWDDVGSWLAVGRIKRGDAFGNVIEGNVVAVDTANTIIQGGAKLIAAVGLEDLILVDTPDAMLVCQKGHAGDIKKVLENLRISNQTHYL